MKVATQIRYFAAILALFFAASTAGAQERAALTSGAAAETRAALVESIEDLKTSTSEMIRVEEEKVSAAAAKLEQLRQLHAEGLVARVEVERAEGALAESRAKIEGWREQLTESDRQLAELAEAEKLAKSQAALSVKTYNAARYGTASSLIRHTGRSGWSVSGIAGVQTFFASAFGRPLPVSAFGQSATHDRFGYDHSNAVDVAVHPDSAEGRALIAYLQRQGIPFSAFRTAIPGVATGPHIHIGRPSGRLH